MTSGERGNGHPSDSPRHPAAGSGQSLGLFEVSQAVSQARDWLLEQQHADGYWCGELQGDTILESEYVLLLTWLGRSQDPIVKECVEYIKLQQLPEGGWSLYPNGTIEISASVKAYWAMKIAGVDPLDESMQRARDAILLAGGAEKLVLQR